MVSTLLVSQKNLFNSTSPKVDISVNTTTDDYLGVSYRWFHNGILLPTSSKTTFQPQQVKRTLDNPSLLNDGVYETQLITSTYSKLTCDNPSPYLFMGTSIVIIRSDIQHLLYYGNNFYYLTELIKSVKLFS